MNSHPTSVSTHSLSVHPLLESMPRIPQALEDTSAMEVSVRRDGILQPLLVDSLSQVLDGRRRHAAALKLGLESVPVKVIETGSEVAAILAGLVCRRHLTKGQLAYSSYPLLEPAVEESRKRRLENLREGGDSPIVDSVDYRATKTVDELAKSLGFSRDLLFQSRSLHQKIEKNPDLRPEVEEAVFIHA
ncbi:MAG: ParB N-terminal domain-containing protein, partial [Verrucomicrobiales bacterium]